MIDKIDALLQNKVFTPVAHLVERRTGRTNFFLAAYSAMLGYVGVTAMCAVQERWMPCAIWGAMVVLEQLFVFPKYQAADAAVHRGRQPSAVPLQQTPPNVRVAMACFGIVFAVVEAFGGERLSDYLWVAFWNVGNVFPFYFVLVPRPPAKPKTEWERGLVPVRS